MSRNSRRGRPRLFRVCLGAVAVYEQPDEDGQSQERIIPEGQSVSAVLTVDCVAYTPSGAIEQIARRLSSS